MRKMQTIDKKLLRKEIRQRILQIEADARLTSAQQVWQSVENLPQFKSARTILAYWSMDDELETPPFIMKWCGDKKFYLPSIQGEELELRPFDGVKAMADGPQFGIPEPTTAPLQDLDCIDLVLVPGRAFDVRGHRLGRGKGFYDRLLPRMASAFRLGIGFDCQLTSEVPSEPHDCVMDAVICGNTVITNKPYTITFMEQNPLKITGERTLLHVSGSIDGTNVQALEAAMNDKDIFTLDFSEVTDMTFTALRAILQLRRTGIRFFIVNLNDKLANMFDSTGVSATVSACRKPVMIDIDQYPQSGESFTAKTYDVSDDVMLKVYNDFIPAEVPMREKLTARAALMFGLPTPMSGDMVTDGKRTGILFERVLNKRSFARAISQEPENVEDYAIRFANMCKELHTKECDTALFPDRTLMYRAAVARAEGYTDAEKKKMTDFIDSVPTATTCIHGDLHIGNVITNGKADLWIDLGDFSYGNPLWDIAMLYFVSNRNQSEEMVMDMFHISIAKFKEFWKYFAKYYFGADTDAKLAEVNNMMEPFAAMQMLFLIVNFNREFPWMREFIRKTLL